MSNKFALIGCGGMGFRHLLGYIEYLKYDNELDLVALVDNNDASALYLSDHLFKNTKKKVDRFNSLNDLFNSNVSLDSVDIATTNETHHSIGILSMKKNLDVMCEKPISLSLSYANELLKIQKQTKKHFALFENFRRDPINRFTKFVIDSEEFGDPIVVTDYESSFSQGKVMHGTGWRTKKEKGGGVVLDAGIHNADLLLYFLGPVQSVSGISKILIPKRDLLTMQQTNHNLQEFYSHRIEDYDSTKKITQNAVDTIISTLKFKSGAIGSVLISDAIPNLFINESWIHGTKMSLKRSISRSGNPILLKEGNKNISNNALLKKFPSFKLDDDTKTIFGEFIDGGFNYDFPEYDRKIIAIEYLDFIKSKLYSKDPEVGIVEGIKSLSLAYAFIEAGYRKKEINLDEFSKSVSLKYLGI